ncbi:MAG: DUF1837 domain-containing protein [Candidatus Tokpelaia sp.]|nr:MAG: DUF1837 domain-containing protein [Candidatus Tokpelaia sp.]KAA6207353.1 MAG: DUF1837 domain-containing protein [Candidatus Tokpelaia sp.]
MMAHILGEELQCQLGDYKSLTARLKALNYPPQAQQNSSLTLHLHYPAFRQGEATIQDLIPSVSNFLINFCLPNSHLASLKADLDNRKIDLNEYNMRFQDLLRKAKNLFIQANKATSRNGECGELLLFILTEWVLEAPQILAKMSLKTSANMPVHGTDGVHCKYIEDRDILCFYFGESKLYQDVKAALTAALKSIAESLTPGKAQHELEIVSGNIKVSGLSEAAQKKLRAYLNPHDELSNNREIAITCLIGFDFSKYKNLDTAKAEQSFCQEATAFLNNITSDIQAKLQEKSITKPVEMFFLPLPSVEELRTCFQNEIGWRNS